jgi:hypothetical protein
MPPKKPSGPALAPTTLARVIEKKAHGYEKTELQSGWTDEADPVDLLVEKGTSPRISERMIGKIARYGSTMLKAKTETAALKKRYDEGEIAIRGVFARHKELRGLRSGEHDLKLNVVRRDNIRWNPAELRSVFGEAYSSIFSETGIISINISPEVQSKKGALSAERVYEVIRQSLQNEGMDEDIIEKTVSFTTDVSADYKKLNSLVKQRKVKLPKKVAKVLSSLAVTVEPFEDSDDNA